MKIDREHAWRTIVGWYSEPGAAEALLLEQQRNGLDVVLHLFLRYVETELHITLSPTEQAEAQRAIAVWRERAIAPLRELRRSLKAMDGLDAIDESRHEWREQLKAMEVKAERVEFMSLCAWLERHHGAGTAS